MAPGRLLMLQGRAPHPSTCARPDWKRRGHEAGRGVGVGVWEKLEEVLRSQNGSKYIVCFYEILKEQIKNITIEKDSIRCLFSLRLLNRYLFPVLPWCLDNASVVPCQAKSTPNSPTDMGASIREQPGMTAFCTCTWHCFSFYFTRWALKCQST